MLRFSRLARCATSASKNFSFSEKMRKLQADPEHALAGREYQFMRERLEEYRKLQQTYAVKQTEVERARKAANMCGLEFTGKGPRKSPSSTKTDVA
jgi:5-bromo-4-chloroindolyl phosphate hydrolysis protein